MINSSPRSHLRASHGPQVIDSGNGRENTRSGGRRYVDGEGRDQDRSKRHGGSKSSKTSSGHRRRVSNPQPGIDQSERPTFELAVIGQPSKIVPLGVDVEASVMVSLRFSSPDEVQSGSGVDTSRLFAVASLVTETRNGDRTPMEAGSMTGQKLFDSVHPIPEHCIETLARNQPCRLALGYFSFPGLLIRQAGSYRIRVSLIQMPEPGSTAPGATNLMAIDSDLTKVERAQIINSRRGQRSHI